MRPFSRRFLLGSAAATAAGIVAPFGRAGQGPPSGVSRVLIVNAPGGLRTTAAFNASPQVDLNPWGIDGTYGELRLGNLMTMGAPDISFAAPSWPDATIPDLRAIAPELALIGAADHVPDGSHRDGDHGDDSARMATGYFGKSDAPGLLTVINRALGSRAAAPVAVIGASGFAAAPGDWLTHAPIDLIYYSMPDTPPNGGLPAVGGALEQALDERFTRGRRAQGRSFLDAYRGTKAVMRKFGPLLADPVLNMQGDSSAAVDGITNAMLLEIGGTSQFDTPSLALALRLLQLGSPAVAIGLESFDWHDQEEVEAPARYPRFARYIAGLHYALANIPDPAGGTLLDSTLVVTTSEFGRSGSPGGFNEGAGSDHGNGPGWRFQSHVVFGAGVTPQVIAPTDDSNNPTGAPVSTHRLLATIAAAVGVPVDLVESVWPSSSDLYPDATPLWDLWA